MSDLFKVAAKFQNKYAQSSDVADKIKQSLINAASWGEKVNGLFDFPKQLKADGANMAITITKSGHNISVSDPGVNPPEFTNHYITLPKAIKAYLEKNIELFPQGSEQNMTFTLNFYGSQANTSEVAAR